MKKSSAKKSVNEPKQSRCKSPHKNTVDKQPHYHLIGRLNTNVAKKIRRKSANIYIDDNHLKHIAHDHEKELKAIGLTPFDFVKLIAKNFNEIRRGSNHSLLLIINSQLTKVMAIEFNYSFKKGFYEVKTATVMRNSYLKNKELLWNK